MSAPTMKLKKGDQVKIVAGSDKGKTGKIVAVIPTQRAVKVEGINIIKKHVKPNAAHPQGGIVDVHQQMDVSKVALLVGDKKTPPAVLATKLTKTVTKCVFIKLITRR